MAKHNEYTYEGTIHEISEPKFLQNGAEVQTIVLTWTESWDGGSREKFAAIGFYAAKGLAKLHEKNLKVGQRVSIPCTPSSRVKEGQGQNGPYRFWQTDLNGDSWGVKVLDESDGISSEEIAF